MVNAILILIFLAICVCAYILISSQKPNAPKKYKVYVLSCYQQYLNTRIAALQDEGWEISGPVIVSNHKNGDTYIDIPFKKIIE